MDDQAFNENEWREYLSGANDIAVAAIVYSFEKEADLIQEDNEIQEYQDVVTVMHKIAVEEYEERDLDWRAYDKAESFIYQAQVNEE